MLSKSVCEKCIKQWCREECSGLDRYEWESREDAELDNLDITWKYEYIVECPHVRCQTHVHIDENAPDECPYALEHVLETQPPPLKQRIKNSLKWVWHTVFEPFVGAPM